MTFVWLLKVQQVLKCMKSTPLMWKRLVLPGKVNTQRLLVVLECLKDRALDSADCLHSFVFLLSRAQLWNVVRAPVNYLKLSCFLHYPLTVWSHTFTGCSQGGKVTFGNTLYTFKIFDGVGGVCDPLLCSAYSLLVTSMYAVSEVIPSWCRWSGKGDLL